MEIWMAIIHTRALVNIHNIQVEVSVVQWIKEVVIMILHKYKTSFQINQLINNWIWEILLRTVALYLISPVIMETTHLTK